MTPATLTRETKALLTSATIASFFAVLARPTVVAILILLDGETLTVSELTQYIGSSQPHVSATLKVMSLERLVIGERQGKCVRYSLTNRGRIATGMIEAAGEE